MCLKYHIDFFLPFLFQIISWSTKGNITFPPNKEDQKTFEEIGKELKMSKMGAKKLIDRIISNLKKKAAEYSEQNKE